MPASPLTPVTLLTGYLGSGKTTLLGRALRDPAFADTAVVINEFGEAPLDHVLTRAASDNITLLPSGCLCCSVAGDLVQALRDVHFKRAAGEVPFFRRVVIETSGLADPAPILRTLIELPLTAARYALAGVVTVVDAAHGMKQLDARRESLKQAAIADRLVISKAELAHAEELQTLRARLSALNPGATQTLAGDMDATRLFASGLYRAEEKRYAVAEWLPPNGLFRVAPRHDARVRAFAITLDDADWPGTEDRLRELCEVAGERLLRMKGIVHAGQNTYAVHAVQHTLYPPARLPEGADPGGQSRFQFVTDGLDEAFVRGLLGANARQAA